MTTYAVVCHGPDPYGKVIEVLVGLARSGEKFSLVSVDPATLSATGLRLQTDTDSVIEKLRQATSGVTVEGV